MNRRQIIAVVIALATMLAALAPPLWVRTTGDEIALELAPVDPLSLFRGNYVDLRYDVLVDTGDFGRGDNVYIVFDDARPARALRVTEQRPNLAPGEHCLQGRVGSSDQISLPALEQYFVTAEDGLQLERQLGSMLGVIRATGSCQSILVSLEPQ